MGPVAEEAFVPTDIDQDIDFPFSMMLCMLPLFSVGQVPLAVGSIEGTLPLPPAVPLEEPLEDPLEEPLEPPLPELLLEGCEPLELPELPLELASELELPPVEPPELPEPLPDDPLPVPESVLSDVPGPPKLVLGVEFPPHDAVMPRASVRRIANEPSSMRRLGSELMASPLLS
jgi:hypothetical protein